MFFFLFFCDYLHWIDSICYIPALIKPLLSHVFISAIDVTLYSWNPFEITNRNNYIILSAADLNAARSIQHGLAMKSNKINCCRVVVICIVIHTARRSAYIEMNVLISQFHLLSSFFKKLLFWQDKDARGSEYSSWLQNKYSFGSGLWRRFYVYSDNLSRL